MGSGLNLGRLPYWLVGLEPAFGLNQMGRKDGVDQSGFPEPGLACEDTVSGPLVGMIERRELPTTITLNCGCYQPCLGLIGIQQT